MPVHVCASPPALALRLPPRCALGDEGVNQSLPSHRRLAFECTRPGENLGEAQAQGLNRAKNQRLTSAGLSENELLQGYSGVRSMRGATGVFGLSVGRESDFGAGLLAHRGSAIFMWGLAIGNDRLSLSGAMKTYLFTLGAWRMGTCSAAGPQRPAPDRRGAPPVARRRWREGE